jgi:hypothetical protein
LAYIDFQATKPMSVEKGENSAQGTTSLSKGGSEAKKWKQKKLTSQEFLRLYEVLWEEGPKVKYLNPENYADPR